MLTSKASFCIYKINSISTSLRRKHNEIILHSTPRFNSSTLHLLSVLASSTKPHYFNGNNFAAGGLDYFYNHHPIRDNNSCGFSYANTWRKHSEKKEREGITSNIVKWYKEIEMILNKRHRPWLFLLTNHSLSIYICIIYIICFIYMYIYLNASALFNIYKGLWHKSLIMNCNIYLYFIYLYFSCSLSCSQLKKSCYPNI